MCNLQPKKDVNGEVVWLDCTKHGTVLACTKSSLYGSHYESYKRRVFLSVESGAPFTSIQRTVALIAAHQFGGGLALFDVLQADKKGRVGWCTRCEAFVPARAITPVKSNAEEPKELCGAACLNGKRQCDCPCEGRCHGAGQCRCGKPNAAIVRKGLVLAVA